MLIVLSIVALLTVISFQLARPKEDKAMAMLYIKAYQSLRAAAYNIQEEVIKHNEEQIKRAKEGLTIKPLKKFPNILNAEAASPLELCKALNCRMNTINEINKDYCYGETTEEFTCSMKELNMTSPIPADFSLNDVEPSLITTDNMRYYIIDTNNDLYYLVYVDLNGSRKPNTIIYDPNKKMADIVPFLIFKTDGEVVPTGYPIFDTKYMTARVLYSDAESSLAHSELMSFAQARKLAYNGQLYVKDLLSSITDSKFENTYLENPNTTDPPDGSMACPETNTDIDFPPCKVEVNTVIR